MEDTYTITGQIVDVFRDRLYPGKVTIKDRRIFSLTPLKSAPERLICPGFIDAHIHIESSFLTPAAFAATAVVHGTIGAVADPHEIANVLGVTGIKFMVENGHEAPFYFSWGAPPCVPATSYETTGGKITYEDVAYLLALPEIGHLAEVMNYPGVLKKDLELMKKIDLAKSLCKPIDGHAPLLRGEDLSRYIAAGISTDHESTSCDEAREKIEKGMKIILRGGSIANNLDELLPLFEDLPDSLMFSADDIHASDLLKGHINLCVKKALEKGVPFFEAIKAATLNPVKHYALKVGLLQEGDSADFIVISDASTMEIEATYIQGRCVAAEGKTKIKAVSTHPINNFRRSPLKLEELQIVTQKGLMRVIRVLEGQLHTESELVEPSMDGNFVVSDQKRDILKLVVVNRYDAKSKPAIAFVRGFGLKNGALATSVAHDAHNIIAVGVDDHDLLQAINLVIKHRGGLACVDGREKVIMPLPVAGLMSLEEAKMVAEIEKELNHAAQSLGTKFKYPFTNLSFLSLLVIPKLKLSDRGLFDGETFRFTPLFLQ